MDQEAIYVQLRHLVDTTPDLPSQTRQAQLPPDTHRWLGQLHALVHLQQDLADEVALKTSLGRMRSAHPQLRLSAIDEVHGVLFRALARAELNAPSGATGSFIAVGSTFDALRALSDVLKEATRDVMIIDPYMAEDTLTGVAVLANECVTIRLLSDAGTVKPGFAPAVSAWAQQYGPQRPLEARLSPTRSLHDRLIFIDGAKVWVLTQSLKDLAKRSPASLTASDQETANLKLAAYSDIWNNAEPVRI